MENTWWRSVDQLSTEQADVIDLPADNSYLILGPAGSGKTNLLILRANYLYLAGYANLRVIVFNRVLQDFLATGAEQYQFPLERITTLHRWGIDILREYGVPVNDLPNDFRESRLYLLQKLNELAQYQDIHGILDVILLDEAQDYLPQEIDVFRGFAKVIFAVADSRQKIYSGDDCLNRLGLHVNETKILKFHYRNGLKICRFADAIMRNNTLYQPLSRSSNYNEQENPSSVDFTECGSVEEEAARIVERLEVQAKTFPGEMLGVVCPTNDDVVSVWNVIASSSLADYAGLLSANNQQPFDRKSAIWVGTVHSFKGLEARAVHIAGLSSLGKFPHQRNMMYMAATRAKTSLSLYASGPIPVFLDGAIKALNPPARPPLRSAAFGGSR